VLLTNQPLRTVAGPRPAGRAYGPEPLTEGRRKTYVAQVHEKGLQRRAPDPLNGSAASGIHNVFQSTPLGAQESRGTDARSVDLEREAPFFKDRQELGPANPHTHPRKPALSE
jgi:hypothetical protein